MIKNTATITNENCHEFLELKEFDGHLNICAKVNLPNLISVGFLDINVEANLPNLQWAGGIDISAKTELPNLTLVKGNLTIRKEAKLTKLASVGNTLYVTAMSELPKLVSVGGGLFVSLDTKLPSLNSVSCWLCIKGSVEFSPEFNPLKLADDGNYQLWYIGGEYRAGCRKFSTAAEALEHWDNKSNFRAKLFTEAIKAHMS